VYGKSSMARTAIDRPPLLGEGNLVMARHYVCITPRSTPDSAVQDTNQICHFIYEDTVIPEWRPPLPDPPPELGGFNPVPWGWRPRSEPWGQIQALGLILQGISLMPKQAPMRTELHDIARRVLEDAVEALGEGVQLVERDLSTAQ
jgi:hypothetical protein